jgi:galactokinase
MGEMAVDETTDGLSEEFERRFGRPASWLISAPGRINLIGEHTDYNGFPVMPMAIGRTIRMAVAPSQKPKVVLENADRSLYARREFEAAEVVPAGPPGDWGNYARAAVQSLAELLIGQGREPAGLKGMCCLVDGDIPPAAGLSSSTALVVAAGLAFSAVNEVEMERPALAERMAEAEHYVGTQGGGMDQAACLLGREGHALKIDFFPLRVTPLPFPDGYRVVAAHSTVQARKTGERRLAFNRRVLECRLGAHLLARQLGVEPPERLSELADYVQTASIELPDLLLRAFDGREDLSVRRAAALLETEPGQLLRQFLRMEDGRLLPVPGDGLKVLKRCRHVFSEAERTETAAACLRRGQMEQFGRLMNESHRSCSEDYEVSCLELDELVEVMREAGALGARLTGAGFGGFAIAVVQRDRVPALQRALELEFYVPRALHAERHVLVLRPAQGAVARQLA